MTEDQWNRIQHIVQVFKPSGITPGNYESLPPDSVSSPPETATARQINYLRVLGYQGPTNDLSKQDACQLIAGLLQGAR